MKKKLNSLENNLRVCVCAVCLCVFVCVCAHMC